MDWFDPGDSQADVQVQSLHRALKTGGKVLLRSAGLKPWYISVFEKHCFTAQRVGARLPGACIDRFVYSDVYSESLMFNRAFRVNMYASAWICTKLETPSSPKARKSPRSPTFTRSRLSTLEEIDLGSPMIDDEKSNVEHGQGNAAASGGTHMVLQKSSLIA